MSCWLALSVPEEMRELIGHLRPALFEDRLLPEVLINAVRAFETQQGAAVDYQALGEFPDNRVSLSQKITFYRILQEALTNTIRHGSAERARVRVSWESGALQIEVADDGTGPVQGGPGTGHGLLGIRERVSVYGGALFTGRSDLGGFLLVARLPTGQ